MAMNPQAPFSSFVSILQNQPTDINFLLTTRFRLILPRAPNLVYWVQGCNLPGFSMENATQATAFVQRPVPGDRIHYNDLKITFRVDEQMKNYREVADWIIGLGFPKQFGQYEDLLNSPFGIMSDIGLIILDAQQNPMHVVTFTDAFPVSISDLDFVSTETDANPIVVETTWKYLLWQFDEVNAGTSTSSQADAEHT
jgi:hypothetical protein